VTSIDVSALAQPLDFAALLHPQAQPAATSGAPPPTGKATSQGAGHAGRAIVTRADKRRTAGLRKAAGILDCLPAVNEVLWGVLYGYFDLCHLLLALLHRIPGTCLHLRCATLSLSLRNAHELGALLDIGAVRRLDCLCSDFMAKQDKEIFTALLDTMHQRGQRVAAARSHCKLLLLEMDDGARWTLSGSANLRTSRNAEAFTLCHEAAPAAPVHDFYAQWFDEVSAAHAIAQAQP